MAANEEQIEAAIEEVLDERERFVFEHCLGLGGNERHTNQEVSKMELPITKKRHRRRVGRERIRQIRVRATQKVLRTLRKKGHLDGTTNT